MRRNVLPLPITALALVGWLTPCAAAQDTKTARGTVTAVAANSIGIKAGTQALTFTVDAKTDVTATGAGTASRKAAAAGKGLTLPELIKVGEAVEVRYHEMGTTLQAAVIRRVADAGGGGGSVAQAKARTVDGTVESISGKTLVIAGTAGGGATFTQTLVIDSNTKVIGVGAGTAAAAAGGKVGITELVGKGDRVTVTYHNMGEAGHASQILVRSKAK
jgi:hypothetical protein